jgi:hypothetical protein
VLLGFALRLGEVVRGAIFGLKKPWWLEIKWWAFENLSCRRRYLSSEVLRKRETLRSVVEFEQRADCLRTARRTKEIHAAISLWLRVVVSDKSMW